MIHSSKAKIVMVVLAAFSAYALAVGAPTAEVQPLVTVREAPEHVVLYTLHRGPYDEIGATIGGLFAVVGAKGLVPQGNVTLSYLNNPQRWSKDHWLTEVSIPVGRDALKLAGTFGDFTDVKVVPASTMAVAVKPAGMADPSGLMKALMIWIGDHAYGPLEGPCEVFPANVSGGYETMQTEIMVPVTKPQGTKAK